MAYVAALSGVNGHAAHDSALDVGDAERTRALEEENDMLRDKIGAACMSSSDRHLLGAPCLAIKTRLTSTTAQRFADYENEIRVLQAKFRQAERRNKELSNQAPATEPPPRPVNPGISRFGSFIGSRKPSTTLAVSSPTSPTAREQELETALIKEQTARIAAEQKVKEVNAEVEDLSATLFQQANEMVATERRENAALKERVEKLEKSGGNQVERYSREIHTLSQKIQVMEEREGERRRRLERLEAAQKRIDRVRTMLLPR